MNSAPARGVIAGQVLPPRNCDEEVAGIMDELGQLQGRLVLARDMPGADLVQRTRVLIVERLFKKPESRRG